MNDFKANIGGQEITFTDEWFGTDEKKYYFNKMTNIQKVSGSNPMYQFVYEGKLMQLPYDKKDENNIFAFFNRSSSVMSAPYAGKQKKSKSGCLIVVVILIAVYILIGALSGSDLVEVEPATFESQQLYEGHKCKITLVDSESTSSSTNLNLLIENSSSLNLSFNAHAYAVNGIMTKNNIYDMRTEVAAGKKANTSLEIDNSVLEDYGIDKINYVEVLFWAYDDDKMMKEFETNVIKISSIDGNDEKTVISGYEIYNKDAIQVDCVDIGENKASYVITNNTGDYFDFDVEGISINGFTSSDLDFDLFQVELFDNNSIWIDIKPSSKFMEKNKIDAIEEIEFYLNYRIKGDYFDAKKTGVIKSMI